MHSFACNEEEIELVQAFRRMITEDRARLKMLAQSVTQPKPVIEPSNTVRLFRAHAH